MKTPFYLEDAIKHPEWIRYKCCPDWRACWINTHKDSVYIAWNNEHGMPTDVTGYGISTGDAKRELELESPNPKSPTTTDDIKKLPANTWFKRNGSDTWHRLTSIDDECIYLYCHGSLTVSSFLAGYSYTTDGGETWHSFV